MLSDLRHLARSLWRAPASAIAAVFTLALTLGVGTALFALLDAVLLTPPPFANPEALVVLAEAPADDPRASARAVNYATFRSWRGRGQPRLVQLEAFDGTNVTLTGVGPAERASGSFVTPGFFSLLGVSPVVGRVLTAEDAGRQVTVISDRFWRSRLSADPDVLGREIVIGGRRHAIVGVLPPQFGFALTADWDLWLPLVPPREARDGMRVIVLGRLAEGATVAEAAALLDEVSRRSSPPARALAVPVETAISGTAATTVPPLVAAAALAILMVVINLAGLLIVGAIDRHREAAAARGPRSCGAGRRRRRAAGAVDHAGGCAAGHRAVWRRDREGDCH